MALLAPKLDLQARFGPLELRGALSSSFFGSRYRARAANTGRSGTHALGTTARDDMATSDAELRAARVICVDSSSVLERLASAATAVRSAAHPALVTPLQIVRERGRLGVISSDVPGLTLSDLVEQAAAREEGLPQPVVLRIVLDLIAGLHALEAAVVGPDPGEHLYGGLTPDSIHVGRDGQTRVLDPGVMAAASRQGLWTIDPRMLAYSAPELHAEGARYDVRVDIFAIGIVLWELLSCRSLFLAASAHETIEAVCRARIARVRRERFVRGEPIMASVANVVARALDRDPSRRFQSYGELAVALRDAAPAANADQVATFVTTIDAAECSIAFEESERVTARPPRIESPDTTARVLVDVAEPTATVAMPTDTAPSDVRTLASPSRRRAPWVIGITLLIALGALAFRYAGRSEQAVPHTKNVQAPSKAALEPAPERAAKVEPPAAQPAAAELQPASETPAKAQPAASKQAPAPGPRKPRPASHPSGPKRPFIPDDI
jgi:serine/threonine protein kinase